MMKKDGSTLTELLVVVGIIAFLLGLSLPPLFAAREHARTIECQANIRRIGLAFDLYYTNHCTFPHAYVPPIHPVDAAARMADYSIDWGGIAWYRYLDIVPDKYSARKQLVQCPSKSYSAARFKYNDLWGSYGVNWSACKSSSDSAIAGLFGEFCGSPVVPRSSRTLLLADSGYAVMAWVNTLPDSHARAPKSPYTAFNMAYIPGASVNAQKEILPWQEEDAHGGRHPGKKVNCLFTDGHIKPTNADDLVVRPLNHGQFENLTPLWKPK